MNTSHESASRDANQPPARGGARAAELRAGDYLPLGDFASLLLAGYFSLFAQATASAAPPVGAAGALHGLAWIAAGIAPFLLYDRDFTRRAAAADYAALARGFARRFAAFLGVILVIAYAGRWLDAAPLAWLVMWAAIAAVLTTGMRVALGRWLAGAGAGVPASPQAARATMPSVGYVGDWMPVRLLADRPIRRWGAVYKAAHDAVVGGILAMLLLPLLALIALAIRLDSPGPVVFRQRRHGFAGREFDIYKFRTMRSAPAADGQAFVQTVRGDPRVTRVGRFLRKWSLDELPQVFNVLQGDMSLVGPRPHAVTMRTQEQLGHEITDAYPHRHRVKPGITGWAQVNGSRGATDTREQLRRRVELDLYYVEHWSPLLDARIMVLTIREVLRATHAF